MKTLEESIKNGAFTKEEILNKIAYAFHYEGWYKDTIEGKFGLNTDGADHGRFRASKNAELDKAFFGKIQFNEEGFSIETDNHGNPLYKREISEDGKAKYFVDSAIKGWDFLPPSWKQENFEAAKVVLTHLKRCENMNFPVSRFFNVISISIHNWWVARQLAGEFGIDTEVAFLNGTLSNDDIKYIKGDTTEIKEPSTLLKNLLKITTKEKLNNIWGIENFVSYSELPFEEQIKDTRQIEYAIKAINQATKCDLDYFVDQEWQVSDKINQICLEHNQNKNPNQDN